MEHRIEIAHKYEGHVCFLTQAPHHVKNLVRRRSRPQRPKVRLLDHDAFRDRIGERNSDLNEVRPGALHFQYVFLRRGEVRVTRRDKRDKCFSARKSVFDSSCHRKPLLELVRNLNALAAEI